MKTEFFRNVLTLLSMVLLLTACASASNRYEEGGIVGTGHEIDCPNKKNKKDCI